MRRSTSLFAVVAVMAVIAASQATLASAKPNVLAIWGDDIGWFNLSIHNFGIMGYTTPNLDRIGKEGGMFTDAYAEQSCTAGRAAFLTGQHGLRSGMLKVGLPGVPFGLHRDDPTIPQILKSKFGYTTGQFGKNHLGDTNPYLPTNRGFDEFFGNLYHLNAEEEPEYADYPGEAVIGAEGETFQDLFGPRGVMHTFARGYTIPANVKAAGYGTEITVDDGPTGDREGQKVYDTGPLNSHRMRTIDGAFAKEAIRFMGNANADDKPFFVWYAASRMHIWTHLKEEKGWELGELPEIDYHCNDVPDPHAGPNDDPPASETRTIQVCNKSIGMAADGTTHLDPDSNPDYYYAEGVTGQGVHPDGMVEHDMYAGELLNFLDQVHDNQGRTLAENTIVMYTSDNGPESFSWPDGGTTPFRSEKATNWEGGYRVPLLVRWPGVIKPGYVSNEIIALQDWFPTLASAANGGPSTIKADLAAGGKIENPNDGDTDTTTYYRAHLDGYDFYEHLKCANDPACVAACDADIADNGVVDGTECPKLEPPRKEFIYANDDGVLVGIRVGDWKVVFQEQRAHGFGAWEEPFTYLRLPKIFNLRRDPFEKIDHESSQYDVWRVNHLFINTPAQAAVYRFLGTFNDYPPRQTPPSFGVNVDAKDIAEKCGLTTDTDWDPNSPSGCYPYKGVLIAPAGPGG